MKGVASSGHRRATDAALRMLQLGGNAFDAILSAAFVSCSLELSLNSLGGGGFLLGHRTDEKKDFILDFFVNHPGMNAPSLLRPRAEEAIVNYGGTGQLYHVGVGSLGVHGTMRGFQKLYAEYCTLDLDVIISPTIEALERGIELSPSLESFLQSMKPIIDASKYGINHFHEKQGRHFNPLLKEFLELSSFDAWIETLYEGAGTEQFLEEVEGAITQEDLLNYRVEEREPLTYPYKDYIIVTNCEPSIGGSAVRRGLEESLAEDVSKMDQLEKSIYRAEILRDLQPVFATSGTTHLNTLDSMGNVASMSLSIGTCSGYFYPNTGILMNNMMGEEDLHLAYGQSRRPGSRICSMMAPTFIRKNGELTAAFGTGGSNRIRSAVLQFIWNLLDEGMSLKDAIEAPRLHFSEKGSLQIEPFHSKELETVMTLRYPDHRVWDIKHFYFGGVHSISGDYNGWGDSRRDGSYNQL
ncbi:MAG: gamma-glutamyltransferase [Chlamydiota bacterium]